MILIQLLLKLKRHIVYKRYANQFANFGRDSMIKAPIRIIGAKHINIGQSVSILDGARIEAIESWGTSKYTPEILIDNGCEIGQGFHLTAVNKVLIHKNVLIAPYVYITDVEHDYKDVMQSIKNQSLSYSETEIGEDSWIGIGVRILEGVHIGKHCIIGANSVVTKDIPENCVAVGIPARVVKKYNRITDEWEKI